MRKASVIIFFFTILSTTSYATVFHAVDKGDWTDPDTWGTIATYPTIGDSVYIDGHSVTVDISNITTEYIAITNEGNSGYSELIVSEGVTLTVEGSLDIFSENSDWEIWLELYLTSTLDIVGSLNVYRSIDNLKNGKIEINVLDNSFLKIGENLIFDFDNTGSTKGDTNLNIHGFAKLEVGGEVDVNIGGGNKFSIHSHNSAKIIAKSNVVIHKNGGDEVYLHFHSDSLTSIAGNMTLQHYGGTGPFLMKVDNSDGLMDINGHLTLESGTQGLLVTNEINGSTSVQKVGGDIVLIAQGAGDVNLHATDFSHLMIGGSFTRVDYGKLTMNPGTSLTYNGTGVQTIASNNLGSSTSEEFTFADVYFDNQSGIPLNLEDTLVIEDALHLTNGHIPLTFRAQSSNSVEAVAISFFHSDTKTPMLL